MLHFLPKMTDLQSKRVPRTKISADIRAQESFHFSPISNQNQVISAINLKVKITKLGLFSFSLGYLMFLDLGPPYTRAAGIFLYGA